MKMRTIAVLAGALFAGACQTWGPTWSEVSGLRYHRALADRWPARIVAVGSDAVFQTPFRVAPGVYRVAVESPRHDGFPGTILELDLKIEPCKRYYINAQFDGPVGPNWRPVVDEAETIAGCRLTAS